MRVVTSIGDRPGEPGRSAVTGRGFTLIELLVVIAIISVLISMMTPSLTRARGLARAVSCGARMRQVAILMFTYANDYGGAINSWGSSANDVDRNQAWWNRQLVSQGFVTRASIDLLRCPHAPPFEDRGNLWAWYTYGARAAERNFEIRFDSLPAPTQYWILGDSTGDGGTQTFRLLQYYMVRGGFNYNGSGGIHLRHARAANMAFGDGHVELRDRDGIRELGIMGVYEAELNKLSL